MVPYIGINDCATLSQAEKLHTVFKEFLPENSKRLLRIGVNMHYGTLCGAETNWSTYPPREYIAKIFSLKGVYNCLQYVGSSHDKNLRKSLLAAILYGGVGINALHLNIPWPDPDDIYRAVEASHKKVEVILQIDEDALLVVGNFKKLVAKIKDYDGAVHRVFFIRRMTRRGFRIEVDNLVGLTSVIKENFPHFGIIVAGGMGPDVLYMMQLLIARFPDISIDAQGRKYPGANITALDWNIPKDYLAEVFRLFEKGFVQEKTLDTLWKRAVYVGRGT